MKLVVESLNELYKFEKKVNPLDSLGISKRVLIEKWLDDMNIKSYIINDNLTISSKEGVYLYSKNLEFFPYYIQFGKIKGPFNCGDNKLTTLRGCPFKVTGSFICDNNLLDNLKYAPKHVGLSFYCKHNLIEFSEEYVRKVCNVYANIYN
jgi:hypothetical protein